MRTGDTLVVPKLDRLARSVPDARGIGDTLAKRGVSLSLGGQIYDPDDPMGKLFFNILATFAEFEVDVNRMRKLSPMQQRELNRCIKPASTRSQTRRAVLCVATDGVPHHQPNKRIDKPR